MLEALHLRDVGVPIDDRVAVLKARRQPGLTPSARARVMHHPDADALDLDDALPRQNLLQRGLVHVPGHALDRRPDRAQLLEEPHGHEVAAVEHEVGASEQPHALVGKGTRTPREMGVRDDGDARQEAATGSGARTRGSCRKRPAFQTSSPSA